MWHSYVYQAIVQSESMLQCSSATVARYQVLEKECAALTRSSPSISWGLKILRFPDCPKTTYNPPSLTLSMCTVQCEHFTRQDGVDVGVPSFPTSYRQPLSVQNPVKRVKRAWNLIFPFCLQCTFHFRLGPQPTIKVDSRSCNFIQPCLLQRLLVRVAGV